MTLASTDLSFRRFSTAISLETRAATTIVASGDSERTSSTATPTDSPALMESSRIRTLPLHESEPWTSSSLITAAPGVTIPL